jgi:flagellar basal-body rod protein FlgG
MLEQSNVNIVDEFVNMILAQRSYESNSRVVKAADEMLQGLNQLAQ